MPFQLLLFIVRVLSGAPGAERAHDRQVERMAVRRRIAHADVPSMETIEATHGARLEELSELLFATDPAEQHTRRSRKGDDPIHVRAMRQRYRLVAWTLIHRLAPADAVGRTRAILEKELSLWFAVPATTFGPEDPEDLVPRLVRWRKGWDLR